MCLSCLSPFSLSLFLSLSFSHLSPLDARTESCSYREVGYETSHSVKPLFLEILTRIVLPHRGPLIPRLASPLPRNRCAVIGNHLVHVVIRTKWGVFWCFGSRKRGTSGQGKTMPMPIPISCRLHLHCISIILHPHIPHSIIHRSTDPQIHREPWSDSSNHISQPCVDKGRVNEGRHVCSGSP